MGRTLATLIVGLLLLLVGCTGKLSGAYLPSGDGIGKIAKFDFTSSDKVEMHVAGIPAVEASYELEGDKVKMTANGQTSIFKLDEKGCLDGGELLGTFCKQ